MEFAICVFMICVTAIGALRMHQSHIERHNASITDIWSRLDILAQRVTAAEDRVQASFDPKAFEDLKKSVANLRAKAGFRE